MDVPLKFSAAPISGNAVALRFGEADSRPGIALAFGEAAQDHPGSVDLVFGARQAKAVPRQARLAVSLAPPQCRVQVRFTPPPREMRVRVTLAAPRWQSLATYENRVDRSPSRVTRAAWVDGDIQRPHVRSGWQVTQISAVTRREAWSDAAEASAGTLLSQDTLPPMSVRPRLAWQEADAGGASSRETFENLAPRYRAQRYRWQEGIPARAAFLDDWELLARLEIARREVWQRAAPAFKAWSAPSRHGLARLFVNSLPWHGSRQPFPGISQPPGIDEPPAPPFAASTQLLFQCPPHAGTAWQPVLRLAFGPHPCPVDALASFTIPVLRVYFVSHAVEVVRLPGREPIPVKSLQIDIDTDSWAWGLTAALPGSALELVEPTSEGPVEIEITVDGAVWVMLVESYDTRREFGQSSLSVRGRSLAAYLAEPYAPKRSFVPAAPFSARQLAEQELLRPGLASGFTLDWRIADWLVPQGAWSYQGLTPVSVIKRIAEAAGGYLNAHPQRRELAVKPRYPVLPWEWSAAIPDVSLPLDILKTLNLTWQEQPAYNSVYVAGERQGVIGHVLRAGTAGEVNAEMVVDALITHADVARERGRAILADGGKQARVTLELPMMENLGLLNPGLLLAVGEGTSAWRGLVRACQISAQWSDTLSVRQTLEVERHYW